MFGFFYELLFVICVLACKYLGIVGSTFHFYFVTAYCHYTNLLPISQRQRLYIYTSRTNTKQGLVAYRWGLCTATGARLARYLSTINIYHSKKRHYLLPYRTRLLSWVILFENPFLWRILRNHSKYPRCQQYVLSWSTQCWSQYIYRHDYLVGEFCRRKHFLAIKIVINDHRRRYLVQEFWQTDWERL